MRVLAVMALLFSLVSAQSGRTFTEVSTQGTMWSPRGKANVEFVKATNRFEGYDDTTGRVQAITLTNYFILYGGQITGGAGVNDVWVASAAGTQWRFVAGVTEGGVEHPRYSSTFTPSIENGHCQDGSYRQYRAGGLLRGQMLNEVWSSTTGVTWTVQTDAALWAPRFFPNMIADSNNRLYIVGGILQNSGNPRDDSNEVWVSSNQGRSWSQQAQLLPPERTPVGRGVAILLNSGSIWGAENNALIWMTGVDTARQNPQNGDDPLSYLSDIWASGDAGKSWNAVTLAATFGRRDDANAEITNGGLIVLAGGYGGTGTREVFNDIWVSANGGYSWGQCVSDAEWEDRRYLMTVLDDQGLIWIMGGELNGIGFFNDVWKSTFSVNDNAAVSQRCKITIPSCGAGLRCKPGDTTTLVSSDGTNVYCNACPYNFGASSQTLVVGMLVVFLLAFLATASLLGFTFYKLRQSGAASPIPLPGAAQRWWNKSTAGSVGGSTDTAAAELYQPLRIRDQV